MGRGLRTSPTSSLHSSMASATSNCQAGLLRFLRLVGQLKVSEWARPGREAAGSSSGSDLTQPPSLSPASCGLDVPGRSWREPSRGFFAGRRHSPGHGRCCGAAAEGRSVAPAYE